MNWREAFLEQARSDRDMLDLIAEAGGAACHRLHYLQMLTEKLAKGMLADPDSPIPPERIHKALVRMLQTLKGRPDVRQRLGFSRVETFRSNIDSLLDVAREIEDLAPARLDAPNPEYPWRDRRTNEIHAPATFEFAAFEPARRPQIGKLVLLVHKLLNM